jgi:hypothetical protein
LIKVSNESHLDYQELCRKEKKKGQEMEGIHNVTAPPLPPAKKCEALFGFV